MKQFEAPWTIFFSWGAFVFLFINFLSGMFLAKHLNFQELILALLLGLIFLSLSLYSAIWVSAKFSVNYSEAIYRFLPLSTYLKIVPLFILLAVNVGWFSIQLGISLDLLPQFLEKFGYLERCLKALVISYLFAFGAFKYEYSWLKIFGAVAMLAFLVIAVHSIFKIACFNSLDIIAVSNISISNILRGSLIVYGTWGFSSSTCIMDIAKYTNKFFQTFVYAVMAILAADILLIFLGYIFSVQCEIHSLIQLFSFLGPKWLPAVVFISLWSTNDSNFFSSMKVLEKLGLNKKVVFLILPAISALLLLFLREDIFSVLGKWLELMGWTSIAFAILWWSVVFKYRGRVSNV